MSRRRDLERRFLQKNGWTCQLFKYNKCSCCSIGSKWLWELGGEVFWDSLTREMAVKEQLTAYPLSVRRKIMKKFKNAKT